MKLATLSNTRRQLAWVLVLALLPALSPGLSKSGVASEPRSDTQRFSKTELHMAVEFEVVLYAADEATAGRAFHAAFDQVARLNAIMSDYEPDSELSRLSETAGSGKAVPISRELFAVLSASQVLAERSGGAFDVTVGPLTKLWRRARRQRELPTAERIAEARAAGGHRYLRLDESKQTATLTRPNMRLDLGGIAKGFAADEALKAIRECGIQSALVRASGDIVAGDPPPRQDGWLVGLAPLDAEAKPERFISLANAAVSTSGDSRQHLVIDGRRYSHLIDPRSGSPVEGRSSISVIARNGTTADSLASAVAVLGPAEGMELVETTPDAAALTIWQPNDEVEPRMVESKRFHQFEAKPPSASP
jgi:FAD:protein FMN transferase